MVVNEDAMQMIGEGGVLVQNCMLKQIEKAKFWVAKTRVKWTHSEAFSKRHWSQPLQFSQPHLAGQAAWCFVELHQVLH